LAPDWTAESGSCAERDISNNVFQSLGASRSVWEDVECKLRCVNFRRESDPRRAFRLAFRVTEISDDCCTSTMGVIVRSLGTAWSARENIRCTWEHQGVQATSLGAPMTNLGAPMTRMGAPATSLGATRITVEQSGKTDIFFGKAGGTPGNHSYYLLFNDFSQSDVFSLYSHLCIYIATHLHMIYLDWLQAVLQRDSRCAWRWRSSELRDTPWRLDQASLGMHLKAVVKCIWRYSSRPWSSELRDALWDHDRASLEMHLEAIMERGWRYIWRPCSSEFGDINLWRPWSCELGGCDGVSLEICTWRPWSSEFGDALWGHYHANLKAVIGEVWTYTWRRWSSEFGDALGGCDWGGLEIHLEAVIERL